MKKLIITIATLILETSALTAVNAQEVGLNVSNQSASASGSNALSGAFAQSNGVTAAGPNATAAGAGATIVHSTATGSDLSNMVPSVSAPNLATTLTETCMGSSSAGASGAGFGFSFGTTWRDSACVRRLDSRQMSAFGDIATAREMMCDSDLVREAAKRAGRPCVEDGGTPYGQVVVVPVPHQVQEVATPESAAPVVKQIVRQ